MKAVEDKLNQDSTKELEKICRIYGLSIVGHKRDIIERCLITREFEFLNGVDFTTDPMTMRPEIAGKKKIEVTVEMVKNVNKLINQK